jgi:hypothetical protein
MGFEPDAARAAVAAAGGNVEVAVRRVSPLVFYGSAYCKGSVRF